MGRKIEKASGSPIFLPPIFLPIPLRVFSLQVTENPAFGKNLADCSAALRSLAASQLLHPFKEIRQRFQIFRQQVALEIGNRSVCWRCVAEEIKESGGFSCEEFLQA